MNALRFEIPRSLRAAGAALFLFSAAAIENSFGAAQIIVTATPPCGPVTNYLTSFDLFGQGLVYEESVGTLGVAGQIPSAPQYVINDCVSRFSGVARDQQYVYFGSNGRIYRKAVSSPTADQPSEMSTPFTPLPGGYQMGPLALMGGRLYWSDFYSDPWDGPTFDIFSMNTDGSGARLETEQPGAAITKMVPHTYMTEASGVANGFFLLRADGSVARYDLSTHNAAVLSSGALDFALRDEIASSGQPVTILYVAKGSVFNLQATTAAGSVWRINAATGNGAVLPGPNQQDQITSVASDSQSVYVTTQPTVCSSDPVIGCAIGPASIWRQRNFAQAIPATNHAAWESAPIPYWELMGMGADAGVGLQSDGNWLYFMGDLNLNSGSGPGALSIKRLAVTSPAMQTPVTRAISTLNNLPGGGSVVQVSFNGLSGYRYRLLRSTNLIDWVPVTTVAMPRSGAYTYVDPLPPTTAFYRAVWLASPDSGTLRRDPNDVHAPLYRVALGLQLDATAHASGGDSLMVGLQAYSQRSHSPIEDYPYPVDCYVGETDDWGRPLTAWAGHYYTKIQVDPDWPDRKGQPIQIPNAFAVDPNDTLHVLVRLHVNDASIQSFPAPENGTAAVFKKIGTTSSQIGGFASKIPDPTVKEVGNALQEIGTVLTDIGDYFAGKTSQEQSCIITDSLVPGISPPPPPYQCPPPFNISPALRVRLSGRELWEATANGDAVVAYDLDWGGGGCFHDPICNRPHARLDLRISRVFGEGDDVGRPTSHSGNIIATEPDFLDAFSVDQSGNLVHDEGTNPPLGESGGGSMGPVCWQTGETVPAQDQFFFNGGSFWWNFLPGGARIAAISRAPKVVDLFAVDTSGRVRTNWRNRRQDNSSGWQPTWAILSPSGMFPSGAPIAVVSRSVTNLDLFAVGNDGAIYTLRWDAANGWSQASINPGWPTGTVKPYDGSQGGGITAFAAGGRLYVYVIGNNKNLLLALWDGTHWNVNGDRIVPDDQFNDFPNTSPSAPLPGGQLASVVTGLSRTDQSLAHLFFIDGAGYVQDLYFTASDWHHHGPSHQVMQTPVSPNTPLAAVGRKIDLTGDDVLDNLHLDVFTVRTDGRIIWNQWRSGFAWEPSREDLVSDAVAAPSGQIGAVSTWAGTIKVVATRINGSLQEAWYESPEVTESNKPWHTSCSP